MRATWIETASRHRVAGLLRRSTAPILLALVSLQMAQISSGADAVPIVIAHRGASGYLPEHTLPAKALAYGMGADFIEQDVVLTRDNVPVVLHDVHLDTVTDVATVFPDRKRKDGRYYALDFDLREIKQLSVHERVNEKTGAVVYPRRFPLGPAISLQVPTLAEEIQLIQGMNRSTGKRVGIYPEIKQPKFHREAGHDISTIVLKVLGDHGYRQRRGDCFVQCFDEAETKRLREELGCELPLIQLLGRSNWSSSVGHLNAEEVSRKLKQVAGYADGIGPPTDQLIARVQNRRVVPGPLAVTAKQLGLQIHPYTLRTDDLPSYAATMAELVEICLDDLRVDGLFTDFPDVAIHARDARQRKQGK
ncbi:MAG: glycerophosphodiester phosphodiesterase [Planctomycetales bacterium]|nr:glycerophosphodiester phosphodiesterase [Planctomycetales bacterium]